MWELETQERKAPELKALKPEVLETLEPEVRELEPEVRETLEAEALELERLKPEALGLGTLEILEWRGARRLGRQRERQTHEQREQLSVQPPAQKSRTMPYDALLSPAPRAPPIPADEGLTPSGVCPSWRVPQVISPQNWTSPPSSRESW